MTTVELLNTAAATRFAFYGRVSTEDNQDPESSRQWQMSLATSLITPRGGKIVTSFFDVGRSRSLPWARRPEASDLLTRLADAGRGFEAVVIGEPHRAFYGNQFGLTLPLFAHYGVSLWVPEVGGPIDPDNEAHDLVMSVFGGMSKGERNRIKVRVRTAMASQTLLEGRYLGGRPPYGYALADLGPHPNPAKAAGGKRLLGLTPDPGTAPIVQRIFAEYLAGNGMFVIAEGLTRDGIASPAANDPERNRHRDGRAWSKSAIRAILNNPRYTGRQVWNRQRSDEVLLDVNDVALGNTTVVRWNTPDKWVVSKDAVHEALIRDEDFELAQAQLARRVKRGTTPDKPHRSRHPYVFKSLLCCAACLRRMQGQHSHGVAYYRCRYPQEYALANRVEHPKNVIIREDLLIDPLDRWLAGEFAPHRREQTIATLIAQATTIEAPAAAATAHDQIAMDYQGKLTRYQAAIDAGADPTVVSGWIARAQADRDAALRRADQLPPRQLATQVTAAELNAVLDQLGDLVDALRAAHPDHKHEVYRSLGLQLTYQPDTRTVQARIDLGPHRWVLERVGGGT